MKKSYQSEISALLFHPNISKIRSRHGVNRADISGFFCQWHTLQTCNRSTFVSVQPAKTFNRGFKSSHSLFTWNLRYLLLSSQTLQYIYIYSMYISPYVCIGNFRRSIFYEYTSIFILIL